MKKDIHVVGAVIVRDGKILCAQRNAKKSLPNLWEFPGGKIEKGETPQQALMREIKEEMQCEVEVQEKVDHTVYEYDFGIVHLTTYFCKLLSGDPVLVEHEAIRWLRPSDLPSLEWAPADIPAIEKLAKMTW